MSDIFTGIDPGAKGAIVHFEDNELVRVFDMPNVEDDLEIFKYITDVDMMVGGYKVGAIEKISGGRFPKKKVKTKDIDEQIEEEFKDVKKVSSLMKCDNNAGACRMALSIAGFSVYQVRTVMWSNFLRRLGASGDDAKEVAKNYCTKVKKEYKQHVLGPRGGYKDGRGDAIAIAEWVKYWHREMNKL